MDSNTRRKKLLITGGHLTPAIAVIQRLKNHEWEVIFMGRKVAQEGTSDPAREMQEIPKLGVKIITIPAGKLPRHLSLRSMLAVLRFPAGLLAAFWHIMRLRPDVILSFGGYVALPTALAGKVLGIPIVTHEQTLTKGLANAIIERFADAVAVSWKETKTIFKGNVVVTGNPLREEIVRSDGWKVPIQNTNIPLLYITGGNQGAHRINMVVKKALPQLLKKYAIVHQCGSAREKSDYTMLLQTRASLPDELKNRYVIRDWFQESEVAWLLRNADLIISRSGANTITEIAYTGATALFIPLPIAGRNEQLANAEFIKAAGTAEILLQSKLSPVTLRKKIRQMLKDLTNYKRNAAKARALVVPNAARKVIKLVDQVYEKAKK
ncbi:UDP-N-acetylglucosamine--N-acetylmuramyl-(pentapeptide) pyrophosphoryl-undecaprenol N-acetylglucosamine transferase [Patescibacteria group bacterium]|nr:UDP-N-acetylglucosamine--N-acetylmuramyl-(pentapeptide) pyrophosphoryl-undecaprenol N-acetylglucosamine transferase [Patescibacteria group bacterium]